MLITVNWQVIISFLFSAYFTLFGTIYAYFAGLLPADILNTTDRIVFRANSRRVDSKWQGALHKGVMMFSDQQIVTGIAILVAGLAGLRESSDISVYHFQVVIYLAWMSSNVHLTTLTVLRSYLQSKPALRTWRVTGMSILFVLLLAALAPTVHILWTYAMSDILTYYLTPLEAQETAILLGNKLGQGGLGIPVRCLWRGKVNQGLIGADRHGLELTSTSVNPDAISSYIAIIIAYAWKTGSLFERSRQELRYWLRDRPEYLLEKAIAERLKHKSRSRIRARYRFLVALYVHLVAVSDFIESFAASLWLLSLGLVWGTLQIVIPRRLMNISYPGVLSQENNWEFGQLMPLFLLILPLAAVIEHFSGTQTTKQHLTRH